MLLVWLHRSCNVQEVNHHYWWVVLKCFDSCLKLFRCCNCIGLSIALPRNRLFILKHPVYVFFSQGFLLHLLLVYIFSLCLHSLTFFRFCFHFFITQGFEVTSENIFCVSRVIAWLRCVCRCANFFSFQNGDHLHNFIHRVRLSGRLRR